MTRRARSVACWEPLVRLAYDTSSRRVISRALVVKSLVSVESVALIAFSLRNALHGAYHTMEFVADEALHHVHLCIPVCGDAVYASFGVGKIDGANGALPWHTGRL